MPPLVTFCRSTHPLHLSLPLISARRSLGAVTSLQVKLLVSANEEQVSVDPNALAELARACPAVAHLEFEGSPSSTLLQLLGSHCHLAGIARFQVPSLSCRKPACAASPCTTGYGQRVHM